MRRWIFPAVAGLLLPVLAVAGPSEPSRFQLQGQLVGQAPQPTLPTTRFQLAASLAPAAPRVDPHTRFLLSASLEGTAKAFCGAPGQIFLDSFEDR